MYSQRRTILASLKLWASSGTMSLMTRRMEIGERPGQIVEYIWNFYKPTESYVVCYVMLTVFPGRAKTGQSGHCNVEIKCQIRFE